MEDTERGGAAEIEICYSDRRWWGVWAPKGLEFDTDIQQKENSTVVLGFYIWKSGDYWAKELLYLIKARYLKNIFCDSVLVTIVRFAIMQPNLSTQHSPRERDGAQLPLGGPTIVLRSLHRDFCLSCCGFQHKGQDYPPSKLTYPRHASSRDPAGGLKFGHERI